MNNLDIARKITAVGMPAFLGFVGIIVFEAADIYWVGQLGPKAVSAVGGASFLVWTLYALMHSTNIGATSLISQYLGSQNKDALNRVIVQSIETMLLFTLLFMLFFITLDDLFFTWMGLDVETHTLAMEYFKYFIWGTPISYIFAFQGHIFNAYGDTKVSNVIMVMTLIINIILDPIFMFGYFGAPAMGIAGAAFVTVLSQFFGVLLRSIYLVKKVYVPLVAEWKLYKGVTYIRPILAIGIPVSLSSLVWTLVFPALTVIITRYGMEPLAGVNIGHRFEGIPYFLGEAFAIAATSLVGQAYGRGDYEEIVQIKKVGLWMITSILIFVSLSFVLFPYELVSLLNNDPKVIHYAGEYLRIVGYFEIFLGWEMFLEGIFNGLGKSKIQMWVRVPLTLFRIPLAYYLAIQVGMGTKGIWWAVSVTTLIKGVSLLVALVPIQRSRFSLSK